jgi:hypothetical protein
LIDQFDHHGDEAILIVDDDPRCRILPEMIITANLSGAF